MSEPDAAETATRSSPRVSDAGEPKAALAASHGTDEPVTAEPRSVKAFAWVLLIVILAGTATVRWQVRSIVLERDEGEFAYMGQLLLDGIPPYRDVANLKWPGTQLAYALGMSVFGQTIEGIRLTLLVVNLISIWLVFLIASRVGGVYAAVTAALVLAVLSFNPRMIGFCAHATHFVVAAALAGLWCLLYSLAREQRWGLVWAGIWFGVAGLMKQPGLAFTLLGIGLIVDQRWWTQPWNPQALAVQLTAFICGVLTPIVVMLLWIGAVGDLWSFMFWTVDYARYYGHEYPWSMRLAVLRLHGYDGLVRDNQPVLVLAALGLASPWWCERLKNWKVLTIGLPLVAFVATSAGGVYRQHYFILMVPAIALLAGWGVSALVRELPLVSRAWPREILALAITALALVGAFNRYVFWYRPLNQEQMDNVISQNSPFRVAPRLSKYLAEHTQPDERVAILGSEPEILFYAHRRSAMQFLYVYPLTERHPYTLRMQQMAIADLEAKPRLVVWINQTSSWLGGPDADQSFFDWVDGYLKDFRIVAVAPLSPKSRTGWLEGDAAREVPLTQTDTAFILQRRGSGAR